MVSLLVLFHSQEFGNTKAMAEAVAEGGQSAGAEVIMINTNEQRADVEEFRKCEVIAIGTPDYYSYLAGNLKQFIDDWYIARKSNRQGLDGKYYGLFYSHGGGGRVKEPFENLFKVMKIGTKIGDTIESVGHPNEAVLKACRELGKQLVKNFEKKK